MPALVSIEAVVRLREAMLTNNPDEVVNAAEHLLDEIYGGDCWREYDVRLGGIRIPKENQ